MRAGSVVVDLAADQGGNCELSQPGIDLDHNGVCIRGMTNPASSMPTHASFLYSRNIANFLGLLLKDGELNPDMDDEILATSCVTHDGLIRSTQPPNLPVPGQAPADQAPADQASAGKQPGESG
jgi:H+-translocating NAD(P) transhydrogenase subunit alpha